MHYKGIVFDLDHTLFDRYATYRAIGNEFYKAFQAYFAKGLSYEDVIRLWCKADQEKVHLGWTELLKHAEAIDLFSPAPKLEVYNKIVHSLFCQTAIPFPFTKPTLTKLRDAGYKLGLITNGISEIQRCKIKLLSLEPYFDEILIPSELGMQKPDPDPFWEMAKRLQAEPSELLYVGDNPINDVDASRNAGYTPVWVKTTGTWEEGIQRADIEIDTVEELLEFL